VPDWGKGSKIINDDDKQPYSYFNSGIKPQK
jgi:hypothetical protein